ncbi:MerR family transcriptional regulator [Lacticaseibacillus sp. GG6-2]
MEPDFTNRLKVMSISVGIGEASRITGATVTQIRYWEKKHLVHSFRREDGGNKRFNFPNLASIILVKSLIDEGYTLSKAAEVVTSHRHQADRLKVIANALIDVDDTTTDSVFNFGQLANDPDYDVIARVDDEKAVFSKVPHKDYPEARSTR